MAKRKVHHNTRLTIIETFYSSNTRRYHVFEVRKDARDFKAKQEENKRVVWCRLIPALRGPSNVKRGKRAE